MRKSTELQNRVYGKCALVTGGGSGIGLAIAQKLASLGLHTLICGRNPEKLENARKAVQSVAMAEDKQQILAFAGDVTDAAFRKELLAYAVEKMGGLDILVNNAGLVQAVPFDQVTEEDYDRIMATNVKAPYFLTQLALPMLRKSECPTVINIGSVVSHKGYPLQTVYGASKHALLGFTKAAANELYQEGIRFHAICPGAVLTDMAGVARPDISQSELMQPDDIADTVEFLLLHRGAVVDQVNLHRPGKAPFA